MQRKYKVIRNMKDDRGYHNPGDLILMDDDQAAPLLAIGCVEPVVEDITPPADKQPDGFPEHDNPPAPTTAEQMTTVPSAGDQPSRGEQMTTGATNGITPAATNNQPGTSESAPAAPQKAPANPTEEQIAKDMEQLG